MIMWVGAGIVFVVAMGLSYASGRSSAHDAMLEAVRKINIFKSVLKMQQVQDATKKLDARVVPLGVVEEGLRNGSVGWTKPVWNQPFHHQPSVPPPWAQQPMGGRPPDNYDGVSYVRAQGPLPPVGSLDLRI